MNFMDVLTTRRSVRKYTDEPLSRETLTALLQAAVQTPSGMNAQPWAFAVLQGADKLTGYSEATKAFMLANLDKFPGLEGYRDFFASPDSNIFYHAPALILVCAKPVGVTADADCTMAAYSLMLAARDMGLGSCWIGFFSMMLADPAFRAELGIPADYRPIAPIIIGHPDGDMPAVEKAAPEIICWQE